MKIPQPFQYQGSKRTLAPTILRYLPEKTERIVEPFAGSAAISIACAARGRAREFWLNDFNRPLAELLGLIINQPEPLSDFYRTTWRAEPDDALEHYYRVREDFNRTQNPRLLLYGEPLPGYLQLALVELEAGRSTQSTLLGRDEVTFESLYLSHSLAAEVGARPLVKSIIEQAIKKSKVSL